MIKSYAKINLFLKVQKLNKSGLHNVQSSVALLDLYDEITIRTIKKGEEKIKFIGHFKNNINDKINSISKALLVLRNHNLIDSKKKYEIIVNKKIPVFGGLGGGTSNAFFLIKHFIKNKISKKLLIILEKEIGSDFRLFFLKHSFQKSLKKIVQFKKKYTFYFVLIYPNIKCSTKEIYSNLKKFNLPIKVDISRISTKEKYIKFIKNENNDLQQIVEKKYKEIKKIISLIKLQKNCLFSRITGSGSVCFGVFLNRKSALLGLRMIQKKLPNYWCVLTKSI